MSLQERYSALFELKTHMSELKDKDILIIIDKEEEKKKYRFLDYVSNQPLFWQSTGRDDSGGGNAPPCLVSARDLLDPREHLFQTFFKDRLPPRDLLLFFGVKIEFGNVPHLFIYLFIYY
jgi:hypothetical protein